MNLSTFSALPFSCQVSHMKKMNKLTAPLWLVEFHDGFFNFNVSGMAFFPQTYKDAYLRLANYRSSLMKLTHDELEEQFSKGCANKYHSKPYSANSYTHS